MAAPLFVNNGQYRSGNTVGGRGSVEALGLHPHGGNHDILQYVKPNTLAKDLELMMECTANGYPKQCMMRFPEVYSGEMTCVK
jgi:hypothetical protein